MAEKKRLERREFLKDAAAVGGAVALGMATGEATASVVTPVEAKKTGNQGYHETQHVRDYYKSARS
ncbi:MAG: twin-arginine translocation signal domain-containing protein [Gammaproteobacteria bacterium]|nr:twin-arginine translocation signal domain-containing protein [Gammaproteobacteria bacterium]